ncbi:MAG: BlaI/MecI/CopY family transcriptional regulator [Oscillospiraceae bacterium]|nr:BlaI/MecI/CopY family transcriptional regulator [Oscillospiraceae bacterium]
MRLSGTEYAIMQVIWDKEDTVTSQDILDVLADKGWKQPTVLTFLNRLQEKGMLTSEKQGRVRRYTACMSREEYARRETRVLLDDLYGGSVGQMVACLSKGGLTAEDRAVLKQILEGEWE